MNPTVLVVDDQRVILELLKRVLEKENYQVLTAETGEEGLDLFSRYQPELTLLDIRLPDRNGIDVLKTIRKTHPEALVITMTAHSGIQGAIEAIREGAYDYLPKPIDVDSLRFTISKALGILNMRREIGEIQETQKSKYGFDRIITRSERMQRILSVAKKAANSQCSTIMIQGESGTGKELLASAIHYSSPRASAPFVVVNCTTLSPELLESDLFGHEKGSFTGAIRKKPGKFETAQGGTVFLDEIGEIDPTLQVKLLRVIQEREFERVGGLTTQKVDIRIIAATNRNLREEVDRGNFREDLFYRLMVIPIYLLPLRERREDIPLLVETFVSQLCREMNMKVRTVAPEAMDLLTNYQWKGNIRELKNVLERAVILGEGDTIIPEHLPDEVRFPQGTSLDPPGDWPGEIWPLQVMIKDYVRRVLTLTGGNKSEAARLLGITRQRLKRIFRNNFVESS
ncbi:MAG: sigma-54-dependent Fis family transcriptional regulator [Deltaproteobacteria bacterium]|nr:sigma-54-dependent Fis family transcriptional regulator [Deltaproteobacteria bacterium]